ncbi:MAG: hypothetical protein KG028_08705 [Actinobacteria bacterium]|nr:hypothetical protein [Actinomycetota bacterium]
MSRPVRTAVPALIAGLALLLAGCGSDSPQDLLAAAPEAMLEQGTVGYQQGVIVSDGSGEILIDTTTQGAQDLQTTAQRLTIHVGEAAQQAGAAGGQTVEVILDGTLAYVHSPELQALAGVEWARFDLTETAQLLPGFDASGQQQAGPIALLHDLRGAVDEIEELGEEEVRGVDTKHLRVMVDVQRAIENAPEGRREDLRTAAEALGVPDRYPMEIWIDGDALPRRIVTLIETDDDAFGPTTREMRTDLFDYGEPVDVAAPDPDDVVDFSELLSLLGGADGAGS